MFNHRYQGVQCEPDTFRSITQAARQRTGMTAKSGQVLTLLQFLARRRSPTGQVVDYFDMDFDEDTGETCTRLFFTSELMIRSFAQFGQFFELDATCKTNRFNMPLVLFVGVDDTHRTTIFGVGLIQVGDKESYTWLLERFKYAMSQRNIRHTHSTTVVFLWSNNSPATHILCAYYTCTTSTPRMVHKYTTHIPLLNY